IVCTTAREPIRWAAAALYVSLPLVLMARQLDDASVATLAAHLTLSLAAVAMAEVAARPAPVPWQSVAWLVAGALGMATISIGIEAERGSGLMPLSDGAVVRVANMPNVFSRPLAVRPPILFWSAAMFGLCILVHGRRTAAAPGGHDLSFGRVLAGTLML